MDKSTRAKIIVDQILALDAKFGQAAPPRTVQSTSITRRISDDPRWEARVSFDYEKGSDGETWHLIELSVYKMAKLTVVVREDRAVPRFYLPGVWEEIFIPGGTSDTIPLLPN